LRKKEDKEWQKIANNSKVSHKIMHFFAKTLLIEEKSVNLQRVK